jgi:hypothetical protein
MATCESRISQAHVNKPATRVSHCRQFVTPGSRPSGSAPEILIELPLVAPILEKSFYIGASALTDLTRVIPLKSV